MLSRSTCYFSFTLSLCAFIQSDKDEFVSYEDRTTRFFPPPVMPRIGGLRSGDTGLADENEEAIPEFSNASCQRFNIVCSVAKMVVFASAFLEYFLLEVCTWMMIKIVDVYCIFV
jgi:hypothetical protein